MTRATNDRNATVQGLKLLFLLVICYGHIFMEGPGAAVADTLPMRLWWVPGDIGLFFFTATSGYFTTLRYGDPDRMQGYWSRKVPRVFGLFLFLNAVLGCFFLVTGRVGVFTWDTLVNLAGLNGFLNWFHLGNASPFGAGQWFFTLLLLFYAVYPLMSRHVTSRRAGGMLLWSSVAVAVTMQVVSPYGHSLWSTAVGFVAGFWLARFGGGGSMRGACIAAATCLAGAVAYRLSGHLPVVAYGIIGLAGYAVTVFSLKAPYNPFPQRLVSALGDILLPLYITHAYFRVGFSSNPYVDSLLVLGMNVIIARLLLAAYSRLLALFDARGESAAGGQAVSHASQGGRR